MLKHIACGEELIIVEDKHMTKLRNDSFSQTSLLLFIRGMHEEHILKNLLDVQSTEREKERKKWPILIKEILQYFRG